MKAFKIMILLFLGSCFACCNTNTLNITESTGILSGADLALCACCGGYVLTIDGDSSDYRVEELPEGSEVELDEAEKEVKFEWTLDRECGGIKYLTIESIEFK